MYGEKGVKSGLYDEMSNAFTSVMNWVRKSVKKAETVENKLCCSLEELYKVGRRLYTKHTQVLFYWIDDILFTVIANQ
uniref:Uncharacterized protein n=1 Tax=Helianthus annuus TaxID=4232 RepID=A0A251T619_HELAN